MNTIDSAAGFRQSLEARLQTISRTLGADLQRIRRKVAFERLLARLAGSCHLAIDCDEAFAEVAVYWSKLLASAAEE